MSRSINAMLAKFVNNNPDVSSEEIAEFVRRFLDELQTAFDNRLDLEQLTIAVSGPKSKLSVLAQTLAQLRKQRKLKQEEVAKCMAWSYSKQIRIETGRSGISAVDLKALLAYYGDVSEGQTKELLALAKKAKKLK